MALNEEKLQVMQNTIIKLLAMVRLNDMKIHLLIVYYCIYFFLFLLLYLYYYSEEQFKMFHLQHSHSTFAASTNKPRQEAMKSSFLQVSDKKSNETNGTRV